MKKFLLALTMFAVVSIQAATYTASITGGLTNVPVAGSCSIYLISLENTDTNQSCVTKIWDANASGVIWTNAAFTTYWMYLTNLVTKYTNILGNIETNTNSAMYSTTRIVAASTNTFPLLISAIVPAGGSITYQPAYPYSAWRGIYMTNADVTNLNVSITYSTSF